jgi:hypothetical protein
MDGVALTLHLAIPAREQPDDVYTPERTVCLYGARRAFVAESADGRLLHIGEVPSGSPATASVPAAEGGWLRKREMCRPTILRTMLSKMAGHARPPARRPCISFAKLIDERLEITLPAQVVEEQKDREVVVRAAKRTFDRAILETKDGQIVPDVVLLLRDRRLIVEFKSLIRATQ